MPIQQTPPPFWYRHPVLTGAGFLWGTWVLLDGWTATVTVISVLALLIALRRRRRARVIRHAGLRARAELEHRFTLDGDPRGTYGRYPPVMWASDVRAVMHPVVAVPDGRQVARRGVHQR